MGMKIVLRCLNWIIIQLLVVLRVSIRICSQEDEYHIHKKDAPCFMYMNITARNQQEYDDILLSLMERDLEPLFQKYQITAQDLTENRSNILCIHSEYPLIKVGINHYHVGGTDYMDLLSRVYGSAPTKWPSTDFTKALYALPSYLRIKPHLVPRHFPKLDRDVSYMSSHVEVVPKYKRAHVTHRMLTDIYTSLQLDRPMVAFVTLAFTHSKGVNNNVGGFFILYESCDDVHDVHRKIRENGAQCYLTNSILHFPQRRSSSNFRRRIDCILTMGYVKSETDFGTTLQLYDPPEEQVYCSCLSIIKPDDTVKYFIRYVTASANFSPTPDMKLVEESKKASDTKEVS